VAGKTRAGCHSTRRLSGGGQWEQRKIRNKIHLTFTGCLGPCTVGNNALLQLYGRSIWLKDLNDRSFAFAVFDYIETILAAGHVLAPPDGLRDRVYDRSAPPSSAELVQLVDTDGADSSGLGSTRSGVPDGGGSGDCPIYG
jgi:hypothetical protein